MKTINAFIKPAVFLLTLLLIFTAIEIQAQSSCEIEKHIKDGYWASILSVIDNNNNTYTIQMKMRNDGTGGDNELSHASFEADPGTYSNISILDHSSNFSYTNIDYGPNLSGDPFDGFKVDGTGGIGNGVAGWFIIEYTLDAPFQNQYALAKHGNKSDKKKFNDDDYENVMNCMDSNNPPVAVDDFYSTPVNTSVSGNVTDNDSDPDGDDLTVNTTPITVPSHGNVTLNSDGTFTYTPTNGYTGTDTFEYEVCDDGSPSECDEAWVTITILAGPTAVNDNASTLMNAPVDIDVLSNDTQGATALDPTSVSFVGTAPDPTTEGTFTVNGTTGLVTFTPVNGYTGQVTIDYEVCDGNSLCDDATITVQVTSVTGPTADDDFAITIIDTPVDINVLSNDTQGTAAIDPTSVSFVAGTLPDPSTVGTFTVNATTGLVTFTPGDIFFGIATIDYEVCDLNSLCSIATITVVVSSDGDADGDGVPDIDDDYPIDPDRAFNNYYPPGGNGTLAYEDLWPSKGDYDFNDLVIDYRFMTVTNGLNYIVETFGTFIVKAIGAGFENGFGFQLANNNIADADILSVTGYDLQEGFINLEANGIEENQSIPTIIVYDNAFNVLEHPGSGTTGVNTVLAATYVIPETVNIYMAYNQDIYTLADLDIPNFNPFIIVDLNRGVEVHLPDYPPTDLADQNVFTTFDDDSDPTIPKYYKTVGNLPWAINIPVSFEYPIEKSDITTVYLKFAEWAESGGTLSQDWYSIETSEYRNSSLIYTHD